MAARKPKPAKPAKPAAPQQTPEREAHRLVELSISKATNIPVSFEVLASALTILKRTVEEHHQWREERAAAAKPNPE